MTNLALAYSQYPDTQGMVAMADFDPVPQEQWLTAKQIVNALQETQGDEAPSYRRVQEVLNDLREQYKSLPENERPYRQLGQAYLYHPEFLRLVASRKTKTGKEPNSNQS